MAANKFNPMEMVKSFSSSLKGEYVRITGWDDEGTAIDVTGRIIQVITDKIEINGNNTLAYAQKGDWTFHLHEFERGSTIMKPAEDEKFEMLYMQILEPGPVLDFSDLNETEGG